MRWVFIITVVIILTENSFGTFNFVIVHNNDIHARFDESNKSLDSKPVGGMARTAYKIKEFRQAASDKTGPPVLFLNAGDTFSGTVWFSIHRWKIVSDFLNLLKPDAMCLGNHEFDDTVANLSKFVEAANFKIVCSNVKFTSNYKILQKLVHKSVVLMLEGWKIGIVGYISRNTKRVANIGETDFLDELKCVQKEAKKLADAGVKVIIALGHAGYELDKVIARKVEDVDLVIGGHTNTFLWNGKQPDMEKPVDNYPKVMLQRSGKRVPVVQANAYAKYLGYLNLTFDNTGDLLRWNGQPIFMNHNISKDREVERLVQSYKANVENITKTVLGHAKLLLSKFECRFAECSLGNFLTDSFIEFAKDYEKPDPYWTNVAIAFANGGSIKTSIKPGIVTIGNIIDAFPDYQQLVVFDVKGSDIIKAMEIGSKTDETLNVDGEFLQTSGVNALIDKGKPAGSKVVGCEVRCQKCKNPRYKPINPNIYYKVITNAYIANGGDGQNHFKTNARNKTVLNIVDTEAAIRYFTKYKIIANKIGDRIKVRHSRSTVSCVGIANFYVIGIVLLLF